MSYCRWSSDNHKSDVYVYHGEEGYITEVGRNRIVGEVPQLPPWRNDVPNDPVFWDAYNRQRDFLDSAEHRPIGLPLDGQHLVDDDLPDLLSRLEQLRSIGYHVPEFVFKIIKEEIKNDEEGPK